MFDLVHASPFLRSPSPQVVLYYSLPSSLLLPSFPPLSNFHPCIAGCVSERDVLSSRGCVESTCEHCPATADAPSPRRPLPHFTGIFPCPRFSVRARWKGSPPGAPEVFFPSRSSSQRPRTEALVRPTRLTKPQALWYVVKSLGCPSLFPGFPSCSFP